MENSQALTLLQKSPPYPPSADICSALSSLSSAPVSLIPSLLNSLLPHILSLPDTISPSPLNLLHALLLRSRPLPVFSELTSVLSSHPNPLAIVQVLHLFVHPSFRPLPRISALLSSLPSDKVLSALLHLPDRLRNVLSSSDVQFDSDLIPNDQDYFSLLALAIFNQPNSQDSQRDTLLATLIRRLVRLNHGRLLVSTWITESSLDQIILSLLRVPQSVVADILWVLVDADSDPARPGWVRRILSGYIEKSISARELSTGAMSCKRPLFRRQKTSIRRLVKAVKKGGGKTEVMKGLLFACGWWSIEEFAGNADVMLQRQTTRLVLEYLKVARGNEQEVMLTLAEGVHVRLGSGDRRIRRMGMLVGEAASRYAREKDVLKFDREAASKMSKDEKHNLDHEQFEDGGDTDLSDIAETVGGDSSDEEIVSSENVPPYNDLRDSNAGDLNVAITGAKNATPLPESSHADANTETLDKKDGSSCSHARDIPYDPRAVQFWARNTPIQQSWIDEDDWTSISSFSASSDDETQEDCLIRLDNFRLRSRIAAPHSIPRLLALLRDANDTSDGSLKVDGETIYSLLRTIQGRARDGIWKVTTGGVREASLELAIECMRLDVDRWPDEYVEKMKIEREKTVKGLVELELERVGVGLVERIICGKHSDLRTRLDGINMLCGGIRQGRRGLDEQGVKAVEAEKEGVDEPIGKVTRRLRQSSVAKNVIRRRPGWSDEGMESVFIALGSGLISGGGAEFLDVNGKDAILWAQGVVCLGVLAGCSGGGKVGRRLRKEVIRMVGERIVHDAGNDVVVRRGCAIVLGGIAENMGDEEIDDMIQAERENVMTRLEGETVWWRAAAEWLERAVQDADVGVRRLARRSLGRWGGRFALAVKN